MSKGMGLRYQVILEPEIAEIVDAVSEQLGVSKSWLLATVISNCVKNPDELMQGLEEEVRQRRDAVRMAFESLGKKRKGTKGA